MRISSEHTQNVHGLGMSPTTTVFFIEEMQAIEFYTHILILQEHTVVNRVLRMQKSTLTLR